MARYICITMMAWWLPLCTRGWCPSLVPVFSELASVLAFHLKPSFCTLLFGELYIC